MDTVGKITIGVGRNLTDVGITSYECELMLEDDIKRVCLDLEAHLHWWQDLSDARQRVLVDMCFNMGIKSLMGFHTTLALIEKGDFDAAAIAMLHSKWATQVGQRANRLAEILRKG